MSLRRLRIATRKSALALWQTEHVASRLRTLRPDLVIELLPLSTRGDEVLDRSLAEIGGKGLFLKELEQAIERREADFAVHSLKDVPMEVDPRFVLAAVLERADPFDAMVTGRYLRLDALPPGARVGTSSLRRQSLLRGLRPDLIARDLRGSVNTRLTKLDAGEFDAIILAIAGLVRLGFADRIGERLTPPRWLPAVAQGAIAIECRADADALRALLAGLDHPPTRRCVDAERAMNRHLHGSCQVPIAGYCEERDNGLWLRGLVGSTTGSEQIRAEHRAASDPESIGVAVAEALLEQGAARLLNETVS